jgi:hypothetical protein
MLILTAISLIHCASVPFFTIFKLYFPHNEVIIPGYEDVVASAALTILNVANPDVTFIVYFNASAVQFFVVFIEFSKSSKLIVFD